jgi:hypothetical protein
LDESLGGALDLYVKTRNGLTQHEDDPEALWKVVVAADNLAETIERGESTKRFIAKLTKYLEDGKKAGKEFDLKAVKAFISTHYTPQPLGTDRNKIIVLVNEHLPGLTQQRLAEICGTNQPTVSRVLSGEDTGGGGNRNWGGARRRPP